MAQFAILLANADLGKLGYQAKRKLSRMPPQSMSSDLTHRLEDFCGVSPVALEDYCLAFMYRLALSERSYLAELSCRVQSMIADSATLEAHGRLIIPDGGLNSPLILQSLFDALNFSACHSNVLPAANVAASSLFSSC